MERNYLRSERDSKRARLASLLVGSLAVSGCISSERPFSHDVVEILGDPNIVSLLVCPEELELGIEGFRRQADELEGVPGNTTRQTVLKEKGKLLEQSYHTLLGSSYYQEDCDPEDLPREISVVGRRTISAESILPNNIGDIEAISLD